MQAAQQIAFTNGNVNIETNHFLKALLDDEDTPIEYLLKKNDVNIPYVEGKLNNSIGRLPKVQGGQPAQSLGRDLNNAFSSPQ